MTSKEKHAANRFIRLIFGKYWSMTLDRFEERCACFDKDPVEVSEYFLKHGMVRFINEETHIEFVKHLK